MTTPQKKTKIHKKSARRFPDRKSSSKKTTKKMNGPMKFEKNTENASNKKNHEKELTKLLIFLFSSNFGKLTSISFKKPRNSITISNQVLIETVVASAIS